MRFYVSLLTTENPALTLSLGRARAGTFAMTAVDANYGFFRITLACVDDCPQVRVRAALRQGKTSTVFNVMCLA
jgi:hypothetical protein